LNLPACHKRKEAGQTLVVVVLIVATSLLVGAGVATRSTSLIQQSTFSEEATQALHFAEACAEDALGRIKVGEIDKDALPSGPIYCDIDGDADGGCDSSEEETDDCSFEVNELSDLFVGMVQQDSVVEVKLLKDNGQETSCDSLVLYWCNETDDCPTDELGLEVTILYNEGDQWKTWKNIYGDSMTSEFEAPQENGTSDGVNYDFYKEIDLNSVGSDPDSVTLQAIRLTPRFSGFHINVNGCDDLPFQGYDVYAAGWFGRSRRKVRVTRGEPALPPIFDYAIFSGSDNPLEKK